MKTIKLTLLLLLSIVFEAHSQTFTFKSKLDSVFMYVDKSTISSGLLQQSGYPIYDLIRLTGQSTDTAIIFSFNQWCDIYKTLATSYINPNSKYLMQAQVTNL